MSHPNIEQRKFTLCPSMVDYEFSHLIVKCHLCARFFAACCLHKSFGGDLYQDKRPCCHHSQVVFTDGACSDNGRDNAKAGLGITIGTEEEFCWSIAVDDAVDPDAAQTSQRAELLAAIEGLKKLEERHETYYTAATDPKQEDRNEYVVITDSEYVVKGITEWFPAWRNRGWRTSGGKRPANLDLFLKLDEYVTNLEDDRVAVSFWHVRREFNKKADELAKLATSDVIALSLGLYLC